MTPRRPWYLLTGLVLGALLGVLYAWIWQPVRFIDTSPASLREDFKDYYRAMIAAAYAANGDLVRARARLELLKDADPYHSVAEQAQRTLAQGGSSEEARTLGLLAAALGPVPTAPFLVTTSPVAVWTDSAPDTPFATALPLTATITLPVPALLETLLPTAVTRVEETPVTPTTAAALSPSETQPAVISATNTLPPPTIAPTVPAPATTRPPSRPSATPTPTSTPRPRPTDTPMPTATPTATAGAPFVLKDRQQICEQHFNKPLVQVQAVDASDQPVPGVEISILWNGGEDHFFTGLKPERGLGYADFTLTPGIAYSLRLGEGGQPVTNLTAVECQPAGSDRYWGAWLLTFIQP